MNFSLYIILHRAVSAYELVGASSSSSAASTSWHERGGYAKTRTEPSTRDDSQQGHIPRAEAGGGRPQGEPDRTQGAASCVLTSNYMYSLLSIIHHQLEWWVKEDEN